MWRSTSQDERLWSSVEWRGEEVRLTVKVGMVLELVSEERAGNVNLLASDDSDLLTAEDL